MQKTYVAALTFVLLSVSAGSALRAQPLRSRALLDPAITVVAAPDSARQTGSRAGQPTMGLTLSRNVGPASSVWGFPETDMGSVNSGLSEVDGAPTANGTGGGH